MTPICGRPTAVDLPQVGLPGGIRTPDPRLRRPPLYPTELQAAENGSPRWILVSRVGRLYRGAQIRTGDPLLPKQVRYQTAPRPARKREREA